MDGAPLLWTRRAFLKAAGATGLSLTALGVELSGCAGGLDYDSLDPRDVLNFFRPLRIPGSTGPMANVDLAGVRQLIATTTSVTLVEGHETRLYAYRSGSSTIYNPVLNAQQGDVVELQLANDLDQPSIIHWHGLHVPWEMDGHPRYEIQPGETYDYAFTVQNRPATYWYHPHPHGLTAEQSFMGLSGLLIIEGADDLRLRAALGLEVGETEIPLVLQDKRLDGDYQLSYLPDHMEAFDGYLGDVNLVNLTVNPSLEVETRWYRFRVLNGANARTYRLSFASEGRVVPCKLAGTDGGLLPSPQGISEVFLASGERVDLLLDLSEFSQGDELFLRTLAFDPMDSMNMMGSMSAAATRIAHGEAFNVLRLVVAREVSVSAILPETLSEPEELGVTGAETRIIRLAFSPTDMMLWEINGETFEMEEYPVVVRRDTAEIWEVQNDSDSMPHPLHIHGPLFQVIDRTGSPLQVSQLAVDGQGRLATDLGYKDTVLVWPGEKVRLAMRFFDMFPGAQTLLIHCHILEHEDSGMMINFRVN